MIHKYRWTRYIFVLVKTTLLFGIGFFIFDNENYNTLREALFYACFVGVVCFCWILVEDLWVKKYFDKKRTVIIGDRQLLCEGVAEHHAKKGWLYLFDATLEFHLYKAEDEKGLVLAKEEISQVSTKRNRLLLRVRDNNITIWVVDAKDWAERIQAFLR